VGGELAFGRAAQHGLLIDVPGDRGTVVPPAAVELDLLTTAVLRGLHRVQVDGHHQVQVVVLPRLLPEQCVDTPPAIHPHGDTRPAQRAHDLDHLPSANHAHDHPPPGGVLPT